TGMAERSPMRITVPLPNWRSIWVSAADSARFLFSSMGVLLGMVGPTRRSLAAPRLSVRDRPARGARPDDDSIPQGPAAPRSVFGSFCQHFQQAGQGGGHGLAAHGVAVALEQEGFGEGIAAATLPGDPDGADGL